MESPVVHLQDNALKMLFTTELHLGFSTVPNERSQQHPFTGNTKCVFSTLQFLNTCQ